MKNKKALAIHVEMVLSFIIFIGFIIFLLAAFPVYKSSKSTIGLDAAERGISDFVRLDVRYFTVVLNKTIASGNNCFCFENSSQLDKVVAVNDGGELIGANYSDGWVCINDTDSFHSIYSSSDFKEASFTGECENLNKTLNDYLIGLEDDIEMVSYNKTLKLIENYTSNYENLKKSLGIPIKENFGFKVVNLKGEEILGLKAMKNIPAKTQVLARNVPVQIAYGNGSFVFAMINVQEW